MKVDRLPPRPPTIVGTYAPLSSTLKKRKIVAYDQSLSLFTRDIQEFFPHPYPCKNVLQFSVRSIQKNCNFRGYIKYSRLSILKET